MLILNHEPMPYDEVKLRSNWDIGCSYRGFSVPCSQHHMQPPLWITKDNFPFPLHFCFSWGGLAYPDDDTVRRVAARCISLYDAASDTSRGARHSQSRRFLDKTWTGLRGDHTDVSLRPIMEALASGHIIRSELMGNQPTAGISEAMIANFFKWVSAFRFVRIPVSLSPAPSAETYACIQWFHIHHIQWFRFVLQNVLWKDDTRWLTGYVTVLLHLPLRTSAWRCVSVIYKWWLPQTRRNLGICMATVHAGYRHAWN